MVGIHAKCRVVTVLCLRHLIVTPLYHDDVITTHGITDLSLLLESIGQVTVGIREVGLQLYGSAIRVYRQLHQTTDILERKRDLYTSHPGRVGAMALTPAHSIRMPSSHALWHGWDSALGL